jgi:uncharacterized protein (TIGR02996 family)
MSEDAAFLAAIRDHPDDDGPRLVYADWLDERGHTDRAEFIRLQCAAERHGPRDPCAADLRAAAGELLAEHAADWLGHAARVRLDEPCFRRGFLEGATLRAGAVSTFLRHAAAVPLRELTVEAYHGLGVPLADFLDCPYLDRLSRLTFHGHFYAERDADRFFATALGVADAGIRAVLDCPHLRRLTGLGFVDICSLTTAGFQALAEAPHLADLRHLNLSVGGGDVADRDDGIRLLADSPYLSDLTELGLRGNGLTDAAASALAMSRRLTRLERLDLGDNAGVGDPGVWDLARSANLAALRVLNLSGSGVTETGAEALADWRHAGALRELDLSFAPLGDAGVRALAAAPGLDGLERLALGKDSVGDAGLAALGSARLPALGTLDLTPGCQFTRAGLRDFAAGPLLGQLTDLTVSCLTVAPADLAVLAASPRLGRLHALALHLTHGPWGQTLAALGANPHLGALRRLELDPPPSADALRRFAATPLPGRLTELKLHFYDGNDHLDVLQTLAAADLGQLRALDLESCVLTDEGARVLAAAPGLPRLRRLRCRAAGLGWSGGEDRLRERWGRRFRVEFVPESH